MKKESLREKATWANIVDEFLNTPPTGSLFRLYIFCFIIWNKTLILFIVFDNSDMSEKLTRQVLNTYTPFAHSYPWLSLYGGPFLISGIIYMLSLKKFSLFNDKSVYYWLKNIHLSQLEESYEQEIIVEQKKEKVLTLVEENLEKEKSNIEITKEIKKDAPQPPEDSPEWKEEYKLFKRTSHFRRFEYFVQSKYLDRKNVFDLYSNGESQDEDHLLLLDYLIDDKCLAITEKSKKPILKKEENFFSFNEKGIFYINSFFFEKENGLL